MTTTTEKRDPHAADCECGCESWWHHQIQHALDYDLHRPIGVGLTLREQLKEILERWEDRR